uniref:Uncharacterized protein n=1 Tax=Cacopsylla melanoneura TaxID=428564 RepID=A0A8D8VGU6_9HEMI
MTTLKFETKLGSFNKELSTCLQLSDVCPIHVEILVYGLCFGFQWRRCYYQLGKRFPCRLLDRFMVQLGRLCMVCFNGVSIAIMIAFVHRITVIIISKMNSSLRLIGSFTDSMTSLANRITSMISWCNITNRGAHDVIIETDFGMISTISVVITSDFVVIGNISAANRHFIDFADCIGIIIIIRTVFVIAYCMGDVFDIIKIVNIYCICTFVLITLKIGMTLTTVTFTIVSTTTQSDSIRTVSYNCF